MADKHIADGEASFKAVSGPPDVCNVQGNPAPFDSFQDLSKRQTYDPHVKARGESILTVGSVIERSLGNAGQGVMSGTALGSGDCVVLSGSPTTKASGQPIARHLSDVAMNNGNTLGKVYTMTTLPTVVITGNRVPCNNPPKTSPQLEELKKLNGELEASDWNAQKLDKYVRFDEANKALEEEIGSLRPGEDSWALTKGAAGVGRALLGFVKDAGMGVSQLAYVAAKRASPVTRLQDQVQMSMLAENIRLGNVCAEQIEKTGKAMGAAMVKPITDAWAKGDYAEAVTRGTIEAATLLAPLLKVTTVGKVGEAASAASKAAGASEAVTVADRMSEAAKVVNAERVAAEARAAEAAEAVNVNREAETTKVEEAAAKTSAPAGKESSRGRKNTDGAKVKQKRKPQQPNRKKWKKRGGDVTDNVDGSTTYTDKNGNKVTYSKEGYPNFSEHSVAEVKVEGLSGKYGADEKLANEVIGIKKTPTDYVWHHVEDGKTMQLVPKSIHNTFPHTGGSSILRSGG